MTNRIILVLFLLYVAASASMAAVVEGRVEEWNAQEMTAGGAIPDVCMTFSKDGEKRVFHTGSDGSFNISIPAGKYMLRLSREGYHDNEIPIEISDNGTNLLILRMTPDFHELGEVVVNGRRYLTHISEGTILYDLNKDERAKGKNLFTALNVVPLLSASATGEITVKGSGTYSVYLNGRPYSLATSSPFTVLSSLSAEKVEAVEVVTDPMLKYGAPDSTPIINIIISKQMFDGLYNTTNLSGSTLPKAHGQELLLASKDNVKFSFSYDYDFSGQHDQMISEEAQYLKGAYSGASSKSLSDKGGEGNWQWHTIRGIAEWSIDSIRTLYADVHSKIEKTDFKSIYHQQWESRKADVDEWSSEMKNSNTSGYVETNVTFRQFLKSYRNIPAYIIGYRFSYNPDNRNVISTVARPLAEGEIRSKSRTKGGLSQHSIKYHHQILLEDRHYIRWQAGANLRSGDTRSYGDDSMHMHYCNDILYVLLGYAGSVSNNWSITAHIKGEYSYLRINSPETDTRYTTNDLTWMPSLRVYYYASSSLSFNLDANISAVRPAVTMLNPFVARYNPLSSWQGNPDLKDEEDYNIKVSGDYYTPKTYMSIGINSSLKKNFITPYFFISDQTAAVVSSYANVSTSKSVGGNYFLQYRANKCLSVDMSGMFSHVWLKDKSMSLDQKMWDYHLTARVNLFLPKGWLLTAKYGRHKALPDAFSDNSPFDMYSLSTQKSFFKGSLTLGLTIDNPFGEFNHSTLRINSDVIKSIIRRDIRIRAVGLNLTYTFSKGNRLKIDRFDFAKPSDMETGVR